MVTRWLVQLFGRRPACTPRQTPDEDRRAHGGDHEQQRRGQAILNEFHHRKIEEIGVAEIAVQHLAEIGDELVEQALVQPVLLTDGGK